VGAAYRAEVDKEAGVAERRLREELCALQQTATQRQTEAAEVAERVYRMQYRLEEEEAARQVLEKQIQEAQCFARLTATELEIERGEKSRADLEMRRMRCAVGRDAAELVLRTVSAEGVISTEQDSTRAARVLELAAQNSALTVQVHTLTHSLRTAQCEASEAVMVGEVAAAAAAADVAEARQKLQEKTAEFAHVMQEERGAHESESADLRAQLLALQLTQAEGTLAREKERGHEKRCQQQLALMQQECDTSAAEHATQTEALLARIFSLELEVAQAGEDVDELESALMELEAETDEQLTRTALQLQLLQLKPGTAAPDSSRAHTQTDTPNTSRLDTNTSRLDILRANRQRRNTPTSTPHAPYHTAITPLTAATATGGTTPSLLLASGGCGGGGGGGGGGP